MINRPEKFGGEISFATYEEMEKAYVSKELYPGDLKLGVTDAINNMLDPIREELSTDEVKKIIEKGYPAPPKAKQKKNAAGKKGKAADVPPFCQVSLKVGKITKVWEHPDSENLFCEEIDVGENAPRMVASGLRAYFKAEDLQDRMVLVVLNLQKRKMAGFQSNGMVMACRSEDGATVELIDVPASAKPGDIVTTEGMPSPTPKQQIKIKSNGNDPWSKTVSQLKTDDNCVACFGGNPLTVNGEALTVKSIKNMPLS